MEHLSQYGVSLLETMENDSPYKETQIQKILILDI